MSAAVIRGFNHFSLFIEIESSCLLQYQLNPRADSTWIENARSWFLLIWP